MKPLQLLLIVLLSILGSGAALAQTPGKPTDPFPILLSNGWKLSPAGTSLPLGDLPLNMQISQSGKVLAVTNNGQSTQSVQLIDLENFKQLDEKIVPKSWYGLAFSPDDKQLYVSGGNDNRILILPISNNKFGSLDSIILGKSWPTEKICPTGMSISRNGHQLFVCTKEDSSLYVLDPISKKLLHHLPLGHEAYTCLLSKNEKELYISLWGGAKVIVYDIANARFIDSIDCGNNPNELILNRKGTLLYVANSGDNSVSVIDLKKRKVVEELHASLYPTHLTGSTTNGLALSTDEKTLFIANADNNCLAVFNVQTPGKAQSMGFIPVGWYPSCVRVYKNKILVANAKGFSSLPNPQGPQPIRKTDNSGYQKGIVKEKVQYIGGLFKGTLSSIPIPDQKTMQEYTATVYQNTPFKGDSAIAPGSLVFQTANHPSPVKHVFYIIKENRTYDQILGDIREGNGDSSLCIFPRKVTPNEHALCSEFVLLDNFYVDAEVSADGHNWSTAAYANDFVEKTWPTSYGSRGGNYDFEGTRSIAFPRDGFIWDYCQRAGISYRTYGEFAENGNTGLKSLEGHMCNASPNFDMDITDQTREAIWEKDFDSLLKVQAVPAFSSIRLSSDHTSGQRKGKISPTAAVADNDLAVGKLIEHLSRSGIWNESLVFILEDDAQNGPDHIDAHRSTVYLAGAYVARHKVIHQMYSTSGLLRTMELVLGLPPMSQYDAAALPLSACFLDHPDSTVYTHKDVEVDLNQRNVALNKSSRRSESFNLVREDAIPDQVLNEVIWKSVRGEESEMPAPIRSAFVIPLPKRADKGDD